MIVLIYTDQIWLLLKPVYNRQMINIAQQISNSVSHNITDQIWDAIDISVEQELSDRLWRASYNAATLNPANPRMRHAVLQEMKEYVFES